MATTTTRLGLRKPDPNPTTGDNVNVALDINASMDTIDGGIGAVACTSGARPATPYAGQFAFETDTKNLIVCVSTGPAVWKRVWVESQANWVATPAAFQTGASTDAVYQSRVTADTQPRLSVDSGGVFTWGSGAAVGDTNLYRPAGTPHTLKTDDSLIVSKDLTVTGIGSRVYAELNADVNLASASVTAQNVTGLVFTPPINSTWIVEAALCYGAGTTADIQFGQTFPAAATCDMFMLALDTALAFTTIVGLAVASGTMKPIGGAGLASFRWARYVARLKMGGTAGNFQFVAAQAVSTAEVEVVKAGSHFIAKRVA